MRTPGPESDMRDDESRSSCEESCGSSLPGLGKKGRPTDRDGYGPPYLGGVVGDERFLFGGNDKIVRDRETSPRQSITLISREHAAKGPGCGTVMNRRQTISVMVNEEDHLRMQAIRPGLQLLSAFQALDQIDSQLENDLPYAFDHQYGYLTACPTNLGTGMRASAMLHLPGLVLSEQITQTITGANKIGLAVRGLYGEGTEALANLFQISNQNTLGAKEEEIIEHLDRVIGQLIANEKNARMKILEDRPTMMQDQIGRAYAVLKFAHIISSKEALNYLSMIRLGCGSWFYPKKTEKQSRFYLRKFSLLIFKSPQNGNFPRTKETFCVPISSVRA